MIHNGMDLETVGLTGFWKNAKVGEPLWNW